jgi:superfamily II DNA or RNA helicase
MIKIIVQNKATIYNLSQELLAKLKDYFSISNPIFSRKMELGLSLWGLSATLKYYLLEEPNKLIIPIGGLSSAINIMLDNGILSTDIIIEDKRTEIADSDYFSKFLFTGKLRDYQQKMVDYLKTPTVGVIEAMTGSGKTVTFISHIFEKKLNTLILVNTIELMNQTKDAIIQFSTVKKEDIGTIGSGEFEIKPITVGLHQTMLRLPQEKIDLINQSFGQIIADEVHITAAELYYKTMTKLNMKYKFGFSATPERADGLTKVIFWATGPLLYVVPPEDLEESLIMPSLKIVETNYYFPLFDSSDYTYMMTDLAENEERNKEIATYVKKEYNTKNDYVCVLCNQISQVEALSKLLGDKARHLTSQTKKKERLEIVNDLKNGKIRFIVSTYALFATGIDVKQLNVLILAAPKKSKVLLKQSAGRIMRPAPGKTNAVIIDFVDKKIELLRNQAKIRHKILNNL